MKQFSLFDAHYEMSAKSHDFLTQYLTRVERYMTKHHIDGDYLDDLKNRIAEKLDALTAPIADKDIISLVNDLGEPEDIFADAIKNDTPTPKLPDEENTGLLSRKKKIIFGVALRLSRDLHIPVLYVRIAFLLLIFAMGTGIWIYLALTLLIPGIFWNDKKPTTTSSSVFVVLLKKTFRIVLFLFLVIMAMVFFCMGTGGMVGALNLWTPIIVDHQDVLGMLTPSFRIAALMGCLSLILMGLGLGVYAFGKPIFGRYSWLTLTLALVLSGAVAGSTVMGFALGFDTNYGYEKTHTQTFTAPITSWTIDLDMIYRWNSHISIGIPVWSETNYVYKTGGTGVTVEVATTLRGANEASLNPRLALLNPYDITLDNNRLVIRPPEASFREIVPLSFVRRKITITTPPGVRVLENGRMTNTYRTHLEDYTPGRQECQYSQYIFSEKKGVYLCDPRGYTRDILDVAMEQYTRTAFIDDNFAKVPDDATVVASGTYTTYPSRWSDAYEPVPMQVRVSVDTEGEFYVEKLGTGSAER